MNEEVVLQLRALDEKERLLWEEYAQTRNPQLLDKIAALTLEKNVLYKLR